MENSNIRTGTTRSGKRFGLHVTPIIADSSFDLPDLLKRALEREVDPQHYESFNYWDEEAAAAGPPPLEERPTFTGTPAQRKRQRERYNRNLKRKAEATPAVDPRVAHRHLTNPTEIVVNIPIRLDELPSTSCGYRALSKGSSGKVVRTADEYRRLGFRYIEWDAKSTLVLVDPKTQKIFAVLVGKPNSPTFDEAVQGAFQAMESARRSPNFYLRAAGGPRGPHVAINDGLYYGQGATEPHRLNTGPQAPMLAHLRQNERIIRLANHASAAFATWAPKLHDYYASHLDTLLETMPELEKNFEKSVFACSAYNFGPIALGDFNPKTGGHLVLEDLKLVVEFPAGGTILIPSAVLMHSNTPVQVDERRISFTQFTPGSIFRFVDNDCMTESELRDSIPAAEFEKRMAEKKTRWLNGLGLWPTLSELEESARAGVEARKAAKVEAAAAKAQAREGKRERGLEKKRRRKEGRV